MSDESTYRANNWAVNVDNGEYWHECSNIVIWESPSTRGRMYRDCHKNVFWRTVCDDCDTQISKETFEKLYQAWRMFHIREPQKTYLDNFQVNGASFYLSAGWLNKSYQHLYMPKIAISDEDFKNMLQAELARS